MFSFTKHKKYRRQEIWEIVKGSGEKMSLNFQQSGYERINEGRLRSTFFANRYDYLRIAKAMLDDWKNDTCVGKYLKNLFKNKISKEANGHSPYSSSRSYAGFFHTDFIGVKGKVFGMNGYGGQNIFINFDTGTIVVAHAVHQNYNWRTLVLQAVSSN